MAKEAKNADSQEVSKDEQKSVVSRFFFIAPLIGLILGVLYLLNERKGNSAEITFSKGELRTTIINIVEKSKNEDGTINMKVLDNHIERIIQVKKSPNNIKNKLEKQEN